MTVPDKSQTDETAVRVTLFDLNGVARGKRLPGTQIEKALQGKVRMPLSVSTVDIWGRDIEENEMIFVRGDSDGICQPTRDRLLPALWLGPNAGTIPVWMFTEAGEPSSVDPRQALAQVVQRFEVHGLTPVVATELEFYLTPLNTETAGFAYEGILSLDQLEAVAPVLDDIYTACKAQGIAADASTSECGPGQFEINLLHRADALLAADDAVFFKHIVKGCARKHGFQANFMAKPNGTAAGSGLHLHFSVLDKDDQNIFDNGTEEGSETLLCAVAGVLSAMPESTLLFAPHYNSYRRLRPETHAPTSVCWGYENRTAAVRIPGGPHQARRIEHRVAGADANPYLVIAAVLGAALIGIEKKLAPASPVNGNAYEAAVPQLPDHWSAAISAFETGPVIADIFNAQLCEVYTQIKRQEQSRFLEQVSPFEYGSYAERV